MKVWAVSSEVTSTQHNMTHQMESGVPKKFGTPLLVL